MWRADFQYDLEFKQRAQILLDLLSPTAKKSLKSVLDLGCGVQYFREVLEENGLKLKYCGVDLYPHKSDNILCDFNANEFPQFRKNAFDCVVCAGLFEYILDLSCFVGKICTLEPKYILCSYNFANISPQNKIWVEKRLNQQELLGLFFGYGYGLNLYKTHKRANPTGYFCFCKLDLMDK
ncbi:methyltransferase domain-containing protein [Helicobacter sp. MIT 05-5294]|uniref:methyltransferase domain-containing protein n=1 Tax=Helicobacter sp. MIT 05-5294 TaxID=1548150 RepID=UPI001883DA4D|nr:methyltransferase domain-containing protein [Helicobacter sp. MIT 05-5294]